MWICTENVDLYQMRQEKSQYYTTISAVINTAVLYDTSDKVQSFATISDVKSHKADATWASLTAIFKHIDFSNCHHLFIASDSPSNQYRNYQNVFHMKAWAVSQNVDVSWVFTETGHGKGPMDGIGGGIKRVVKDTISYNPNSVIRNTKQLLEDLPELENIIIDTYNEDDITEIRKFFPCKEVETMKIACKELGISKVHEIYCDKKDEIKCRWSALSSDEKFSIAQWHKKS